MLHADFRVLVVPELRGLDGDLRVDACAFDEVDHLQVVIADLVGLADVCDVLTQTRQDGVDPRGLDRDCRANRILDLLARHELRHRSAHKPRTHRIFTNPGVRRGPENGLSHHRHGES